MITLTAEEKQFVIDTLKPLLKKNDMSGVRNKLKTNGEDRVGIFLMENGVDLFEDLNSLSNHDVPAGIERINIPAHIKNIDSQTFYGKDKLISVTFEEGVESIGSNAFSGTGIKQIKLPKSIKQIGSGAFSNCSYLKTVILPETVTTLPKGLFKNTPDDIVIYTNSRKGMSADKQLRCIEAEVEWYANHLKLNTDYLYEGKSLKEAWSPSTPDWLKPRLNTLVKNYGMFKYNGRPRDDYDYRKPRGTGYRTPLDMYSLLRDKNIDFETINYIEGEIPQSKSDERINLPNIGVWHFPDGQVYMKGLNDNEKYNDYSSPYFDKAFGSIPFKMFKTEADAFVYFNINEAGEKDYDKLKAERTEWNSWSTDTKKNGNTVRIQDKNPTKKVPKVIDDTSSFYGGHWAWDVDKSGYYKIPSSEKYADVLRKIHAKDYAEDLENFEKRLKNCFISIQNDILSEVNWDNPRLDDGNSVRMALSTCLGSYEDALTYYKQCLKKVAHFKSVYGDDEEGFLEAISETGYGTFDYHKKDTERLISNTENQLANFRKVYIDF